MSEITKLSHDDFVPTEPNQWDFSSPYANEADREQVNQLTGLFDTLAQRGDIERQLTSEYTLHEKTGKAEMPGFGAEQGVEYRAVTVLDEQGTSSEVQVTLGSEEEDKLRIILTRVGGNEYEGVVAGRIEKENKPLDKETARFLEAMAQDELIKTNLPEDETQA